MSIILYPHNEKAYISAMNMLQNTGKAAIIHPTGTGKSFIGLYLAWKHPQSVVCWLSPSEYIYNTQLENWATATDDNSRPENIKFFTYAKLMIMSSTEIAEIRPDFIILDEFHRAGAEAWQRGVENLLSTYSDIPVLGITATNVRYLDNQRDMAEELFDNNIASQMTLGEAIVQGILNPPKYVLAVFKYKEGLGKLERKIKNAKNIAVRQSAEERFEKLKRALENAEGIDSLLQKHIPDKSGKYLVFCSNAEHMDDMIKMVPKWFGGIDKESHIYRAYSEDPNTFKIFRDFKADQSKHLKLLFCIDMLNEGIHVDDVNGVILLRPTISPIIYKQQIGRAFSASKKFNAVIFDIVLNFENLYSIDEIKEEMSAAITYYRYREDYDRIVNDSFLIVDETRDCRQLFEEIESSLTNSWDVMYAEAKKYYEKYGNLIIPRHYIAENGSSLGRWLHIQRCLYKGTITGSLTDEQIAKLEDLGVFWENYSDVAWERNFSEAKEYFEKHGNLLPSTSYITENGIHLGEWLGSMRVKRANKRFSIMTPERIDRLNSIGMVWNVISDQWEKNYLEAAEYYKEHGDLLVPGRYVTKSGLKLGFWISRLRREDKELTDEQKARLELIGMVWNALSHSWMKGYQEALNYKNERGNLNVPRSYVSASGFNLSVWLYRQRIRYKNNKMPEEQARLLQSLGIQWSVLDSRWMEMYNEVKEYYKENGNLDIPHYYSSPNGHRLKMWLYRQRKLGREKLTSEQIGLLEDIGMEW